MKVYILEHQGEDDPSFIRVGVYASRELVGQGILGEIEDYERVSDTEEWCETEEGKWFVTEETVINE